MSDHVDAVGGLQIERAADGDPAEQDDEAGRRPARDPRQDDSTASAPRPIISAQTFVSGSSRMMWPNFRNVFPVPLETPNNLFS